MTITLRGNRPKNSKDIVTELHLTEVYANNVTLAFYGESEVALVELTKSDVDALLEQMLMQRIRESLVVSVTR